MNKTTLFQKHVDLKAKMVPFAGYEMPIQYEGVKAEALAVRNNVGMFDVSHMAEFWISGAETENFVNQLIPNDFGNLPIGKAIYSPLLKDDGGIIDDLIAYKVAAEKTLICVNAANHIKDWEWISEKAKEFNIEIHDESSATSLIALQGPNSEKVMTAIGLGEANKLPYYGVLSTDFNGNSITVARTGYTGEDGFEIFHPNGLSESLWEMLLAQDVTPCGLAARDVLRLEVCYPLYGQELNEDLIPTDCALGWTIKKDKENFIGKNSLKERSPEYLQLKLILEKGIPREGYSVKQGDKEIGIVTSGTMSVVLGKGVALARVKRSVYEKENSNIYISIRGKDYPVTKTTKAFVSGGHK